MEAPGSLGSVRRLGPLAMILALVVTITQWASIAGGEAWMIILLFGVPSLTLSAVAFGIARMDRKHAWLSCAVGFVMHFFVILVSANAVTSGHASIETLVVALIVSILSMGLVSVITTPLLIATHNFALRKDLASGDGLLGFAGLWFIVVQALELLVARSEARVWLPMMALSLVPVAIAVVRGMRRRAWCRRVERGEIPGLRLRAWDRRDLDFELPAVDDAPHGDLAVVERFEVGNLPYRSGLLGVPIVTMRSELELTP
jgi:hypothetical protein